MKKIIYINAFGLLLLTSSCSDSFLESDPVMSEMENTYYSTDSQMFSALMATYDALQEYKDNALGNFVPFGEIRSDNARTGGGGDGDQPDMQKLESFTNTNVNTISEAVWKKDYEGIYRANLLINASYTSEEAKVYKAEAKFLRAWYYFDLLRYYGTCYISLKTVYPAGYKFTRNTRDEVFKQIEKDLTEAIPDMEESFTGNQIGRVTKTSGEALLGKTYLYWADLDNDNKELFDKAGEQFQLVLDSHRYTLFTDYSKLFASHSENNSESIFEIQRCSTSGQTNWGTTDRTEGNYWMAFCGPRGLKSSKLIYPGWGFLLPTKELYDYFLDDDNVRRDACVWTHDELEKDGATWDFTAYNQVDFQGFAQKKYSAWMDYNYKGAQALNNPGNERIIRYGEIYLLRAECYLRGTNVDEGKAKELINELRLNHVYGGNKENFKGVDELIASYPERFKNIMDVLWYERRCELAGEGDRWFDLVRSGRAKDTMSPIISKEYGTTWNDKYLYIPIGSIEVSNSGGSLTEYPE